MIALTSPPPDVCRDARASGHAASPDGEHCLSIVHKTRNWASARIRQDRETITHLEVWPEGSLAIFPAIPNCDPRHFRDPNTRGGIRGPVMNLSHASRRNLMTHLAKWKRDAVLYTMALTLPGDVSLLTSPMVHEAFKVLCNRFTASKLFPSVGFVWKRELQKRLVLHYHLVLSGLENERVRDSFQQWIAQQWNELVCDGLPEKECKKHLQWHLHPKNMEKVRKCIAGYFAKYIGKPLEEVREEIPGRWWGKVNAKALPMAEGKQIAMPARAAIIAHRIARKLAKKRANEARHRSNAKAAGLTQHDGSPSVSQFQLIALRHLLKTIDPNAFDEATATRTQWKALNIIEMARSKGIRWGKSKSRKYSKYSEVKLISQYSANTTLEILRYTKEAMKNWSTMTNN